MSSLFSAVGACRVFAPHAARPQDVQPQEARPGEFEAAFLFPPSFPGFAGHFPGKPVLPGIAQIMAVVHACGFVSPTAMQSVKVCKFLRPVFPGERIDMTVIQSEEEGGDIRAKASLRVGDEVCASMVLIFVSPGQFAGRGTGQENGPC